MTPNSTGQNHRAEVLAPWKACPRASPIGCEPDLRRAAVAYLEVDGALNLVGAGGHPENSGLAAMRLGEPALAQAFFLEGLLPLMETPYFVPAVEASMAAAPPICHFHLRCRHRLGRAARCDRQPRRGPPAAAEGLRDDLAAGEGGAAQPAPGGGQCGASMSHSASSRPRAMRRARNCAASRTSLPEARTLQLALAPPPYRRARRPRAHRRRGA